MKVDANGSELLLEHLGPRDVVGFQSKYSFTLEYYMILDMEDDLDGQKRSLLAHLETGATRWFLNSTPVDKYYPYAEMRLGPGA